MHGDPLWQDEAASDLRADLGQRGGVEQHVGVVGVRHRAGAFARRDRAAQFAQLAGVLEPDGTQIVIGLAQVTDTFSADAARPDIAVGRDMATGPARMTGDFLLVREKHFLRQLVVLGAERLRHPRQAVHRL